MRSLTIGCLLCALVVISSVGCGDDSRGHPDAALDGSTDASGPDGGADARPPGWPPEAFDRFCEGRPTWNTDLTPTAVPTLSGTYLGAYSSLPANSRLTMKIIPKHPFQVTTIRAAFTGDPGIVKFSITPAWGRSYPDNDNVILAAFDYEVVAPDPETWEEIDISAADLWLEPTQHYILMVTKQSEMPRLAVEDKPAEQWSRALMHIPGESLPWGSNENFRLQLAGNYFCQWNDADRLFGEDSSQPFADVSSSRAAFTDLNGDGHDDLVLNAGGPVAFLGDGLGNFADPGFDPFPDVPLASMLVFADLNGDNAVDAFAAHYVGVDDDGDGVTKEAGDCDDASNLIHPGATEVPDNGVDDDCDGTTDDGSDLTDRDGDGFTVASGDCNDLRDDTYPGAPESKDNRDNNCDGQSDEIFVNRILINDGAGHFAALPNAGVELLDHSTAAGFGDADGDGRLDLYWGNWLITYPQNPAVQDRYFTGNGDGTFADAFAAAGLTLPTPFSCYGVMWNDYNNDGHQDIFVGNYHMYRNQLWQNQGDSTFVDVAEAAGAAFDDIPGPNFLLEGGHTYGGDFGDIDNDGDLDAFICNLAHPRVQPYSDPSMFLVNQGAPDYVFTNALYDRGFIYDEGDVNASFADFDNDMDLDLVVGTLYTGHFSKLYRNDGGTFTDVTYETGTAVHDSVSVVWSDVDEDGDLDLIIADRAGAPWVHLFINRVGQDNQWIELLLEGTTTNRSAIGARVTLTAGGVTQLRDIRGGGGHSNNQNSRVVHFGLAQETSISELTVRWVGGATETITGCAPGNRYRIVESSGTCEAL